MNPDQSVAAQAIEQVMRVGRDELAVLAILETEPGTPEAAATLGRLLTLQPETLHAGCPLIAFVTGTHHVNPHWREAHPPRQHSLFAELQTLIAVYGPPASSAPWPALESLRAACATTPA